MLSRVLHKTRQMHDRHRARQLLRRGFMAECKWDSYRALEAELPGTEWRKYFNLDRYLVRNVERLYTLDLHQQKNQRILDIGCGTGLFMQACRSMGHRPLGINLSDPLFDRTLELFSLPWIEHRVTHDTSLPVLPDGPFDLITGFEIKFDEIDGQPWETEHWQGFLASLKPHMHVRSRVFLKVNQRRPAEIYDPVAPAVRTYFESLGAKVRRRSIDLQGIFTKI